MISRFAIAMLLLATGALPAAAGAKGSERTVPVDTIVVHAISGPSCSDGRIKYSGAPGNAERWKRFFDNHPFLGIHYVIDRDGVTLASTPEDRVANHARNNNASTIGIELVHNGDGMEPFSQRQIAGLIRLLQSIRTRHRVPVENIKSHSEVDVRTFTCGEEVHKTKMDPGENFPWGQIRSALLGGPRLIAEPRRAVRPVAAR